MNPEVETEIKTMTPEEHAAGVILPLESTPTSINCSSALYRGVMNLAEAATLAADQLKRKVIYGAEVNIQVLEEAIVIAASAIGMLTHGTSAKPRAVDMIDVDPRLFHAFIGMFGEAGELLNALNKAELEGFIDETNLVEELGDVEWYAGLARDELKVTHGEVLAANGRKLKKRYPEGCFLPQRALVRDVQAEQDAIKGGAGA